VVAARKAGTPDTHRLPPSAASRGSAEAEILVNQRDPEVEAELVGWSGGVGRPWLQGDLLPQAGVGLQGKQKEPSTQ
jgi:hypothetical protein